MEYKDIYCRRCGRYIGTYLTSTEEIHYCDACWELAINILKEGEECPKPFG